MNLKIWAIIQFKTWQINYFSCCFHPSAPSVLIQGPMNKIQPWFLDTKCGTALCHDEWLYIHQPPAPAVDWALIATESCASLVHPAPHMTTSPSYMAINTLTHVHKHTQIGHSPSCESCEPCPLILLLTLNPKRKKPFFVVLPSKQQSYIHGYKSFVFMWARKCILLCSNECEISSWKHHITDGGNPTRITARAAIPARA